MLLIALQLLVFALIDVNIGHVLSTTEIARHARYSFRARLASTLGKDNYPTSGPSITEHFAQACLLISSDCGIWLQINIQCGIHSIIVEIILLKYRNT